MGWGEVLGAHERGRERVKGGGWGIGEVDCVVRCGRRVGIGIFFMGSIGHLYIVCG